MEFLDYYSNKINIPILGKPKLNICLSISTIFCLILIIGENGLQFNRFQASHDSSLLYTAPFDLIHYFSGGNLNWSLFDLSNKTFLSFGTISYSIFNLPISIIYFLLHKLMPAIPENQLYRNVFIFSFFPLINLCLTSGIYFWISALKINNFFVSVVVIPIMTVITGNEIWALLLTAPSIVMLPYMLLGVTLILKSKYKSGIAIFFTALFIAFIQTPLLFTAYILPLPWCFLIFGGLIKLKNNFFLKSKDKHSPFLSHLKKFHKILYLILLFIILGIFKVSFYIFERPHRYEDLHKFFVNERIGEFITSKIIPILSYPLSSKFGIFFELLSRFTYLLILFLFLYLSFLGISSRFKKLELLNFKLEKFKKIFFEASFKNKFLGLFISIIFIYLLSEIFINILDLFENYNTESDRLLSFLNISRLHIRNFVEEPISSFFIQIFRHDYNIMLKGHFGYFGQLPFLFSLIGIFVSYKFLNSIRELTIPVLGVIILFLGINISPIPFAILFFFILSIIYPFAALANNLSMTIFSLDYLAIPFIAIGSTYICFLTFKFYLYLLSKLAFFKKFQNIKSLKNKDSNNVIDKISLILSKLNITITQIILIIITILFAIPEIKKIKIFNSLGWNTIDKLKIQEGKLNSKNIKFIIDTQNPLLKSSPLFTYKGTLPIVKGTHPPNLNGFNSYGRKQLHTGQYYKTLFLNRFMELPSAYEIRHKSLVKGVWDVKNECQRIPYSVEESKLWFPDNSCKIDAAKPNKWPNYFINIKNQPLLDNIFINHERNFLFSDIPEKLTCRSSNKYSCNYINKISIRIYKSDLQGSQKVIKRDNSYSLKLPNYLNHLNTSIFDSENHINLVNESGDRFESVQGFLIDNRSFDIGNIKAGYLTLSSKLNNYFQNDKESYLDLEINSAPNVSLLRYTSAKDFTYFIKSKKNQKIIITSPYSKSLNIIQNKIPVKVEKTLKPIKGLVKFNSKNDGISIIKISYKNHNLSSYSFVLINSLLTSTYLFLLYLIFRLLV